MHQTVIVSLQSLYDCNHCIIAIIVSLQSLYHWNHCITAIIVSLQSLYHYNDVFKTPSVTPWVALRFSSAHLATLHTADDDDQLFKCIICCKIALGWAIALWLWMRFKMFNMPRVRGPRLTERLNCTMTRCGALKGALCALWTAWLEKPIGILWPAVC